MAESTLEDDLIEVINMHIKLNDLHPQEAARTMAKMIPEMLDHLSWQPQSVRAAVDSANELLRHLAH